MDLGEILESFFGATSVQARYEAVKRLSSERAVPTAARDPRFDEALSALAGTAAGGAQEVRLLALATLMRIQAQVRSNKDFTRFEPCLAHAVSQPLPPPQLLEDPDDRLYSVRALTLAKGDWVTPYLAEFVITEDAAEKARAEAMRVLLAMHPSIDPVFTALAAQLEQWQPQTQNPLESVARRLVRILQAVDAHLSEATEARVDASRALARMVRPRARSAIAEVERAVVEQFACLALRLIHTIIRIRFSLAADERTYEPLSALREWYQPHQWARFVQGTQEASVVKRDLGEALLLLARQGRTDRQLMRRLELLSGSEEAAREVTARLAQETGIPEDVRTWLLTGNTPKEAAPDPTAELVALDREATENQFLGQLLRLGGQVTSACSHVEGVVLRELEILAPESVMPVHTLCTRTADLVDSIRSFAARRGLRLRWNAGEIVEFSPLEHEMVETVDQGFRWVRVVQPAVEQVAEGGGVARVVRKALVEPASAPQH